MSFRRPKNKFEFYFHSIGELLYLICFLLAVGFIFGNALYQLTSGNFVWFKENSAVIFLMIIVLAIGISLVHNGKKRKKKE